MFKEEEHPRDEDGKFTFKNGGGESKSKTPAQILYGDSIKQKEAEENKAKHRNRLLNILGDKATPADVLYNDTNKLEKKIKELGLTTGGASDVNNSIGNWQKPVEYQRISSPYGMRLHPTKKRYIGHTGIDMAVSVGKQVKTPMGGTVEFAGEQSGYGYVVIINHGKINGKTIKTKYAHLSKFNVKKGDILKANSNLGLSGGKKGAPGSGTSTGPHLHFEVLENNTPVNPMKYLKY